MPKKLTLEQFIHHSNQQHNYKYDYSLSLYVNNRTPIIIICPVHGEFYTIPNSHTSGQGCPKCGKENGAKLRSLTLEQFLERARLKHGDKYDYSKVNYINSSSKICIVCPKHGDFWQTSSLHINNGTNCPLCAVETRHGFTKERFIKHCNSKKCDVRLYLLKMFGDTEEFLKIGITTSTINHRFCSIDYDFVLLRSHTGSPNYIWELEKTMHLLFKNYSYKPLKYFKGHTECYNIQHLPIINNLWNNLTS